MDPDSNDNRNLLFSLPQFGKIALDPKEANLNSYQQAKFVMFPRKMTDQQFVIACEWAARTQTPIYCVESDATRFLSEGFYNYRFNILRGYDRIRINKGSLEFFPIKKTKRILFFNVEQQPQAYQVLVRPDGCQPLLFLSDLSIEEDDAVIFKQFEAGIFCLDPTSPIDPWRRAEALLDSKISSIEDLMRFNKGGVYLWEKTKIRQEIQENGNDLSIPKEVESG
ncbi:hypothetical protein GW915_02210 [bacterium]|nr:hypothetical protein [bacterium]